MVHLTHERVAQRRGVAPAAPAGATVPAGWPAAGTDSAGRRSPLAAAALVVALIAAHLVWHRDEGGWLAKATPHDAANVSGHLVEWEWLHVGETVALADAVGTPPSPISSQDMYRCLGALLIAALREPL